MDKQMRFDRVFTSIAHFGETARYDLPIVLGIGLGVVLSIAQ